MDNNNNVEVGEMLDWLIFYKHSATMSQLKMLRFRTIGGIWNLCIHGINSSTKVRERERKKKKKKKKEEEEEEKNPPPTFLQHSYNSNDYLESQMYLCTQLSEH